MIWGYQFLSTRNLGVAAFVAVGIMAGYVGRSIADTPCPNEEIDDNVMCDLGPPLDAIPNPCGEFSGRETRCDTAFYTIDELNDREARRAAGENSQVVAETGVLPPGQMGPPTPQRILCASGQTCIYDGLTGICQIGPAEEIMQDNYRNAVCYIRISDPIEEPSDPHTP